MSTTTKKLNVNIAVGPAGRAIAQPMDAALVESFQYHLTMERNASADYFAKAIWFAERELNGFALFFNEESKSEQIHASKFADYLIARGQTVLLQDIPAPDQSWSSVEDIMADSFRMESDVTTSLHNLYAIAERSSDMRTTVFLDPNIESQLNSENEFAHLLGRVRFADNQSSAMLIIDGELTAGNHSPLSLSN